MELCIPRMLPTKRSLPFSSFSGVIEPTRFFSIHWDSLRIKMKLNVCEPVDQLNCGLPKKRELPYVDVDSDDIRIGKKFLTQTGSILRDWAKDKVQKSLFEAWNKYERKKVEKNLFFFGKMTQKLKKYSSSLSRQSRLMHQSIPAVPIPPDNRGTFAHVDNSGGGAL